MASVVMGSIKVACIIPPMVWMERYGRKVFLYVSTLGMLASHLLLAVAFYPGEREEGGGGEVLWQR